MAFETAPEMKGLRVLVVDNHAATQEFLQTILESFGFECAAAETAEEGFRLLEQQADKPFGLALVNCKLPGGTDGMEAARHIRSNLQLVNLPIILLGSADEMLKQDEPETLSGILVKPITHSQLFDAIMQVFGHKTLTHGRSATDSVSAETIRKLQGKQVLVVEDNEINQLVAMELLQQMGMLVSVTNSGEQAVRMVRDGNYQAVLMDIQMPGMDGFQATAQIRKNEGMEQPLLPVIAMTAHALNGDSQKALEAGFSDYVSKPVDVSKLANVLVRWLDKPITGGVAVDKSRIPQALELPETLDSIDMVSALRRLGENKKLYKQLLLRFQADHALDAQKICAALKNNELELAKLQAHTLRGLAGTIGADKLAAATKELETALTKLGKPFSAGLLTQVEQQLTAVLTSISKIS